MLTDALGARTTLKRCQDSTLLKEIMWTRDDVCQSVKESNNYNSHSAHPEQKNLRYHYLSSTSFDRDYKAKGKFLDDANARISTVDQIKVSKARWALRRPAKSTDAGWKTLQRSKRGQAVANTIRDQHDKDNNQKTQKVALLATRACAKAAHNAQCTASDQLSQLTK